MGYFRPDSGMRCARTKARSSKLASSVTRATRLVRRFGMMKERFKPARVQNV